MNFDSRKCNTCLTNYTKDHFDLKQYICKSCRAIKYLKMKNVKIEEDINERTPLRNEYFKIYIQQGGNVTDFNKYFIKLEQYNLMKNGTEKYRFYKCSGINKFDKDNFREEYKNKYFLFSILCYNKYSHSDYIVRII